MNIKEMHYDFKQKMNKLDSNKKRNFLVPEIDWKLNEAIELFVKMVAEPRIATALGFEKNQRTINDIRTIVVKQKKGSGQSLSVFEEKSYISLFPSNYWFTVNAFVYADKGSCKGVKLRGIEQQQDDLFEESPFNRSSFEWRESNINYIDQGILVYSDGSFIPRELCLTYIKRPVYVHNAQDHNPNGYKTLEGTMLTGVQNCDLPIGTHREIVDIAVAIASGDINAQDFNLKQYKLNFNK